MSEINILLVSEEDENVFTKSISSSKFHISRRGICFAKAG